MVVDNQRLMISNLRLSVYIDEGAGNFSFETQDLLKGTYHNVGTHDALPFLGGDPLQIQDLQTGEAYCRLRTIKEQPIWK